MNSTSGAPCLEGSPVISSLAKALPCPFCGSSGNGSHADPLYLYGLELDFPGEQLDQAVHCRRCGAYGPQPTWNADAIDLWNVRKAGDEN